MYLDEILTWANTMNFNSIHFNVMHDPMEFSPSRTPQVCTKRDNALFTKTTN